ncbi:hypothetical protein OR1_02592 [Geobacter sp. OR-1]|nr:hypothetical protein [Geobacter sp. OR-1]GAM10304.1 hypothetical protein OR1_02592 [Geobacter sp. OR-1]
MLTKRMLLLLLAITLLIVFGLFKATPNAEINARFDGPESGTIVK